MKSAFYVEFHNDDVGPFAAIHAAEAYRRFEGNMDETQVFSTQVDDAQEYIDLATFCPDAEALA